MRGKKEDDLDMALTADRKSISESDRKSLEKFVKKFKNKSKIDSKQICREIRGKN
jgi:hypothetical protein